MSEPTTIYTIGHSSQPLEKFIALLQEQGIKTLVDVRSQPYSRWSPQFNRENLAAGLGAAGFEYIDLGQSLGGRPEQPDLYDPGSERPNYDRQRTTLVYQAGLDELCSHADSGPTAVMCSEGDPDHCHRTLLITPDLLDRGYLVQDILPDGRLRQAEKKAKQLGFDF